MKRVSWVLGSLGLLLGCSGSGTFATTSGLSVMTPSVSSVTVAALAGGFGPLPPPAGAACDPGKFSYELQLDHHRLLATLCRVSGPTDQTSSYVPANDDLALTTAQLQTLKDAADAITVSTANGCGADKPTLELRVLSGSESQTYGDDFYACNMTYTRYVASNKLDAFVNALTTIDH
jgi:hypothetical protein